ncbi:MAG: glycosyltransferase family 9 protein [Pseudomonadota bacterium]
METLALHLGALGDFVLSWPALGLLAAGPPASGLTLVGNPAWGRLLLPPERVWDRESARLAGLYASPLPPALGDWLAGFDRAVLFARRADPVLLTNLRAGVAQVWVVPTRPEPGQGRHAGQAQVAALRDRGLEGPARPLPVILDLPAGQARALLAPGSGGRDKRLHPELTRGLAQALAQRWGPPTVLLGPAEEPSYRLELRRVLGAMAGGWLADPSLPELAAALAVAPAYVGADSGVSHLAAALGAPCLAIFQASDPLAWAPRGARARACGLAEVEAALAGEGGLAELLP